MRGLELLRAGYGLCQLLRPELVAGRLFGLPLDSRARLVVRVLGARQLLQALATAPTGNATVHRLSGGVDTLHALSMVALAAVDPGRRRAALCDGGVASAFAVGELRR